MLDWPLYTPSPNREYLYKVASPGKTPWKNTIYNTISFERGPRRERCLGRAASARQKVLQIEALLAHARARRAQGPIHPEDPFQGKSYSTLDWPLYTPARPGKNPEIFWRYQTCLKEICDQQWVKMWQAHRCEAMPMLGMADSHSARNPHDCAAARRFLWKNQKIKC